MALTRSVRPAGTRHRCLRALLLTMAAAALLVPGAAPADAAARAQIPLPLTPGGASAMALGVNAGGVVVGSVSDASFTERATVWIPRGRDRYTAVDLNGVAGASLSQADAVDPAGVVAGFAVLGPEGPAPEVWRPDGRGGYVAIGLPHGGAPGRASAIDPQGVVVGEIDEAGLPDRPVVWTPDGRGAYGAPVDLATLSPELNSGQARGIDRAGAVAGTFQSADRTASRAVVWRPAGGGASAVIDLGTLPGGTRSQGLGIDASGEVAGSSDGGSGFGGAVWSPDGHGGYGPAIELSPLPGGTFAFPAGIGPNGIVPGTSNGNDFFLHATAWVPLPGGGYRPVDLSGPGGVANAASGDLVAGTLVPPATTSGQAVVWRL